MKKFQFLIFTLVGFYFFAKPAFSQEYKALDYINLIDQESIKSHVYIFASDSMEGRETGQTGMHKATNYAAEIFKKSGLQPAFNGSYFQKIPFYTSDSLSYNIKVKGRNLKIGTDFYVNKSPVEFVKSVSGWIVFDITIADEIFFGKYGNKFDGKPVMIVNKTKISDDSLANKLNFVLSSVEKYKPSVVFIENDLLAERVKRQIRRQKTGRLTLATHEVTSNEENPVVSLTGSAILSVLNMNTKQLNNTADKSIINKSAIEIKGSPYTEINVYTENIYCNNVAAYLEGTDKKEEVLILTAHLDHLGKRGNDIYYGADDNASGSAAILSIARAFQQAADNGLRPSRSILFMLFTAEEKGLLGSEFYVKNPAFPLNKTITNLNIDMIGRSDTVLRTNNRYVYIIGSDKLSSDLHRINESSNTECCNLKLDYTYNDDKHPMRLYYRSDQYNFIKNDIPAIFYFTGLHADYHKPSDTPDKVDFEKTTELTRFIFTTAWNLANEKDEIRVDLKK